MCGCTKGWVVERETKVCEPFDGSASDVTELGFAGDEVVDYIGGLLPTAVIWDDYALNGDEIVELEMSAVVAEAELLMLCEATDYANMGEPGDALLGVPVYLRVAMASRQVVADGVVWIYATAVDEAEIYVEGEIDTVLSGTYEESTVAYMDEEQGIDPETEWDRATVWFSGTWSVMETAVSVYYETTEKHLASSLWRGEVVRE